MMFLNVLGVARADAGNDAQVKAAAPTTKTIVLVHGMFMTQLCWEDWKLYLESKGFTVIVPPWPEHVLSVEEMRKAHPSESLGKLTLDDVVNAYAALLGPMPEKPILMGHSMGGLVVQRLMAQKLGSAAVLIDSAPPKGVFTARWSFLKSNLPVISPFKNQKKPYFMDLKAFKYTFANVLSDAEAKALYDRQVVPESRMVAHGPTSKAGYIDFAAPHAPLLFIAGGKDHILPASLNLTNARKYKREAGVVAYKVFEDRAHATIAEPGWQSVADYALSWLANPVSSVP